MKLSKKLIGSLTLIASLVMAGAAASESCYDPDSGNYYYCGASEQYAYPDEGGDGFAVIIPFEDDWGGDYYYGNNNNYHHHNGNWNHGGNGGNHDGGNNGGYHGGGNHGGGHVGAVHGGAAHVAAPHGHGGGGGHGGGNHH